MLTQMYVFVYILIQKYYFCYKLLIFLIDVKATETQVIACDLEVGENCVVITAYNGINSCYELSEVYYRGYPFVDKGKFFYFLFLTLYTSLHYPSYYLFVFF